MTREEIDKLSIEELEEHAERLGDEIEHLEHEFSMTMDSITQKVVSDDNSRN